MNERFVEMPFLKNIGLLMTLRCQVTCPHCIVQAGPHERRDAPRRRPRLDPADRRLPRWRHPSCGTDRRRALLNLESLRTLSDFGAASGCLISGVTNAFGHPLPIRRWPCWRRSLRSR